MPGPPRQTVLRVAVVAVALALGFATRLESRPGAGATRAAPGGTESILLVEDDRAVRTFVARTLAEAGYTVHEAGAGSARWRSPRATEPSTSSSRTCECRGSRVASLPTGLPPCGPACGSSS